MALVLCWNRIALRPRMQPNANQIIGISAISAVCFITVGFWLNQQTDWMIRQSNDLHSSQSEGRTVPEPTLDFVASLPTALRSDEVLQAVIHSAEFGSVSIRQAAIEPRRLTLEDLPQVDVIVDLQGNYLEVRNWLDGMRRRFSALALHSLNMHRADAASPIGPAVSSVSPSIPISSTVRLRLFSRPSIQPDRRSEEVGAATR